MSDPRSSAGRAETSGAGRSVRRGSGRGVGRGTGRGVRRGSGRGPGGPVVAVVAVLVAAVVSACGGGSGVRFRTTTSKPASPSTAEGEAQTPAALFTAVCEGAPSITDVGEIDSPVINEASGLVASWGSTGDGSDGVWFTHNDSGGIPAIYAINGRGQLLATIMLDGAKARDWEDIAVGPPATEGGPPQVYVGDIGNNQAMLGAADARQSVRIYRLDEPQVPTTPPAAGTPAPVITAEVTTFSLRYPETPHDAEAMVVDPVRGDIWVITKDWERAGKSLLFRMPKVATITDGTSIDMLAAGEIPLEPGTLVTSADVTRDGSLVALRSYGAVDLYRREEGRKLSSAFESTPCGGPVPTEVQGESVAFAPDGGSYLTVSEGEHPMLHRTSP